MSSSTIPAPAANDPMIKIWLFRLKESSQQQQQQQQQYTVSHPIFQSFWSEVLAFCSTYTSTTYHPFSSSSDDGDKHILLQSETDPSQLCMISGYPSLELNLEADAEYVRKGYMARGFEMAVHQRLFMLRGLHVTELLDFGDGSGSEKRIVLVESIQSPKEEAAGMSGKGEGKVRKGKGGWDCYEPPRKPGQQDEEEDDLQKEKKKKKSWIHVLDGEQGEEDVDAVAGIGGEKKVWKFRKIMGAK